MPPLQRTPRKSVYKIETPEQILTKFGTVDYVTEVCLQTKFGDDRISGGF